VTASTFAPRPEPRRRPVAEPKPHLWVVRPESRSRRLTRLATAILVVAVFAGLFTIVAVRVVLAQGQAEIDRLSQSIEAQQAVRQDLRLTVAELEAPAQIVASARQRLGMITPAAVTYLTPPPAAAVSTSPPGAAAVSTSPPGAAAAR
jgi:cell division protein FtsL